MAPAIAALPTLVAALLLLALWALALPVAAPVRAMGTTLVPGTPVALFQTRIVGGGTVNVQGRQYDVAHDGRFLINTVLDDAASPMTVILNWKPGAP